MRCLCAKGFTGLDQSGSTKVQVFEVKCNEIATIRSIAVYVSNSTNLGGFSIYGVRLQCKILEQTYTLPNPGNDECVVLIPLKSERAPGSKPGIQFYSAYADALLHAGEGKVYATVYTNGTLPGGEGVSVILNGEIDYGVSPSGKFPIKTTDIPPD